LPVGDRAHEVCAQIETVRRIGFNFLRQGCGAMRRTLRNYGGLLGDHGALSAVRGGVYVPRTGVRSM